MKIHKELTEISNDLQKISRRIEKLKASITETKGRTKKARKSGTQIVLDMIRSSRKGIAAGALIKKTGFKDKIVRNILSKAIKEGKIERVGRAVYKGPK